MAKVRFFFLFSLSFFFLFSLSSPNPDSDALLSFKASSDPSNSLSSWSNSTQFCLWSGVTCNIKTNRVTRLVLEKLNLSGPIEALSQLTELRLLSLKNNHLSSSSSLDISSWKNLMLLYISHNQFSGTFPSGISQLRRLHRIDLSYNRFSGELPLTSLTQLPQLLTLRLESNLFSGFLQVSSKIDSFKSLVDFNVSKNNLSGEIPKPLFSFPSSSFIGNKNLCGKPLLNQCVNGSTHSDPLPGIVVDQHRRKKFSGKAIILVLLIDFSIVALIAIAIYIICRRRRIKRRNQNRGIKKKDLELKRKGGYESGRNENGEMMFFEGSKHYKVDELLKASAEMLGKGSVGSTYKVVMDNGDVVVVKRAKEKRKKKEVEGLLKEIGGLRHCNIVSLRAYYCSRDELLLVYDYLPNGSLHSLLHGNRGPGRTPLNWATRLQFALGVAEGLVYLHDSNKSKLCHGHLTPCNIVIDQEGNACISDVALHQLFLITTPTNTEYIAPELMLGAHNPRKLSRTSDVYSFGVILLELLTGKMAVDGEEMGLVKWVQSVKREEWVSEVFDFELLSYKADEEEMMALLQIALLCVTPKAGDRPKMNRILKMIKDIKLAKEEGGMKNESPANDLRCDSSSSTSTRS